ncbi:Uncharacterised protein [Shigella sonnei]|nr:Uncharacterised protein [Shigella sonnei]
MRAGRTLPNLLWSTTSTCFCAIDMAQCFTGNSSRLKQVVPLLTCTAGVKFTTAQKCAAMGFLFQRQKGI